MVTMAHEDRTSLSRNILYSQIILIHFIYHITLYSLPMFLIYMMSDVAISFTQAGLLWTVSIITTTVCSIPIGLFTDHIENSHFPLMFLSDIIMLLGLGGLVFASSFIHLLVGFIIVGIGASGYHPPAMAEITKMFENMKGKALSLNINIGMIGTAISPLLVTGAVLLKGTWQKALLFFFYVGFSLILLSVFLVAIFIRKIEMYKEGFIKGTSRDSGEINFKGEKPLISSELISHENSMSIAFLFSAMIIIPLLLVSIRSSLFKTASFFTSFLYYNYLHLSKENTSIATAIVIGFGSFFTVIGGTISDKYKPRTAILYSSIGTFIATLGLVLIVNQNNLIVFSLLYFLLIASYYLASPATSALLADRVPAEKRGKMFAALFSLGQVFAMVTPFIFGYLKDAYSLFIAFVFMLLLGILTIMLSIYIFMDDKENYSNYLSKT